MVASSEFQFKNAESNFFNQEVCSQLNGEIRDYLVPLSSLMTLVSFHLRHETEKNSQDLKPIFKIMLLQTWAQHVHY